MNPRTCDLHIFITNDQGMTSYYRLKPLRRADLGQSVAAFRVVNSCKDPSPVYVVRLAIDGQATCDCPQHNMHAQCKHADALVAAGVLPSALVGLLLHRWPAPRPGRSRPPADQGDAQRRQRPRLRLQTALAAIPPRPAEAAARGEVPSCVETPNRAGPCGPAPPSSCYWQAALGTITPQKEEGPMASVYHPGGRKIYRIEYKDQHGATQTASSGMMDRRAAEGLAGLIERDVDRIRAGLQPERPDITGPFLGLEAVAPRHLPIDQIIESYLADLRRQSMSPHTLKARKGQLRMLTRRAVWKTLHDITPHRVTAALAALSGEGRAASTTNAYRDNLNAFLEWCMAQGLIETNVVRKVRRAKAGPTPAPKRRRAYGPTSSAASWTPTPPAATIT